MHPNAFHRFILCMALSWFALSGVVWADERLDFFELKIRPVLIEHCYACHSAESSELEGGLLLDSREAMRRGGESGPAVMPQNVDQSLLISAIKYESHEMPPQRKLPDEVVANFVKWIEQGAFDPRDEVTAPREVVESTIDFVAGRKYWAFQPPLRHAIAIPEFQSWCRNDIDQFVAGKLHEASLAPSDQAGPNTLLRRLAFDLTGLPPTVDMQAQAKLASASDYARLVDDLIASPEFGEHWARLWLDVMRFADDQAHIVGDDKSLFFPNSYLYRDWVVDSLNHDMPYTTFIELQLAADLATPEDLSDDVALGFVGLGPKYYRRKSPEVMADEWEDRVDTLSRGLLGLTVACARCHDHKFDPIGTADYYALAGVFASVEMYNRPLDVSVETNGDGQAKQPEDALHIIRDVAPVDLAIMVRGDVNRKAEVVPKRFLEVLCSTPAESFQGSGRLELARAIASPRNPLTARVFVNRVWSRLVGQPLVSTPSNFGSLGQRPSHPELLDDLAVSFMQHDWSLKWLCREIVTSATYQQSSQPSEPGLTSDQGNRLLWRMNRKRLSVEQWRDAMLVATSQLDHCSGGPSCDPSQPIARRRTLYSQASRLKLNPMLALFDYPDPNAHSERRAETTTPAQKLFLLNSPFMVYAAGTLANRLSDATSSPSQLVDQAYVILFARHPTRQEQAIGLQFLSRLRDPVADEIQVRETGRLERFLHALLVTNEMMFVE